MKALFGAASLLVALGVVSMLVKKQLPAGQPQNPQQQSQAVQQLVKQQVEAVLQQPRPVPDDK